MITETWLSALGAPITAALNKQPSLQHFPRNSSNIGGGIGIIYKSTLSIPNIIDHRFSHSKAFTCSAFISEFSDYFYIILDDFNIADNTNIFQTATFLNMYLQLILFN